MNSKLNIIIVIESFFDGGAEMFAIRLANELALNQNVYFIELYPYLTKEKRHLSLISKRVRLLQLGQNYIGNWLYKDGSNEKTSVTGTRGKVSKTYQLFKKIQVKLFIKRYKIEIVNSHSWDSDVYFARLKTESKFKLLSSFHGHYEFLADKRFNYDAITKFTVNVIDKVIYTSPRHQKTLDKYHYPTIKRQKIFYGVSMSSASEITNYQWGSCLNIIMAARGIKEKGWEEAILAVLSLLKKYPGLLKLILVGEGEWLEHLKIKYNDPAIIFLGYQNDVQKIVEKAHIGILPTYYVAESLPNTIIEYLFCGKPVITTNIGAIKEMILYNQESGGIVIDLQDGKVNEDSLSAAIENYIINPALVKKHSLIALKAAKKFTMKTCVENYLNAYRAFSTQ